MLQSSPNKFLSQIVWRNLNTVSYISCDTNYFSPDDKHVLVTNTLTTGNPQEKNTIWVFDSSGKEILAIPIADKGWPT